MFFVLMSRSINTSSENGSGGMAVLLVIKKTTL